MLGTKIERHHILGCGFTLLGFVIVGYAGVLNTAHSSSSGSSSSNLILGIVLNILYLIVVSFQAVIEEMILRKYPIDVQRMIGLEGQFGLIWSFLMVLGCGYVVCPNPGMCTVIQDSQSCLDLRLFAREKYLFSLLFELFLFFNFFVVGRLL